MAKRLQDVLSNTQYRPESTTITTITLLPAGRSPPNLYPVANSLFLALSKIGAAIIINSKSIDHHLGEGTISRLHDYNEQARVSSWLTVVEEKYRY